MATAILPPPARLPGNHMPASSTTSKSPEPKGFKRIRSSLENTIRTATRSRAKSPVIDDPEDVRQSSVMKKLEKVTFRRGKETLGNSDKEPKEKDLPFEPFVSPSLRKATMSSPSLSGPPSSFAHFRALSPSRLDESKQRERRASAQPANISSRNIGSPTPLTPRAKGHKPSTSVPITPTPPSNQSASRRGLVSSSTSYLPSAPKSISPPSSPTSRQFHYEPRNLSPSPPPTTPPPRRPSIDRNPRRSPVNKSPVPPSPSPSPSPTPKVRPRERSPSQRVYSQNRLINTSNLSLAAANLSSTAINLGASSPIHQLPSPSISHFPISAERESIRSAATQLLKEVRAGSKHKDWDEVELRIRALARAERVWGKSSSISPNAPQTGSLAGEERERKLFIDTLKDGYVLCFLINRLSPRPVVLPSLSPNAVTSNVNKFLAACGSHGLIQEDIFQAEDLLTSEDLEAAARIAQTITALVQHVPSRIYNTGRAASSTPNLGLGNHINGQSPASQRATQSPSPTRHRASPELDRSPTRERDRKRYSPPSGLPPVRSESPSERSASDHARSKSSTSPNNEDKSDRDEREAKTDSVLLPPPRNPLRARTTGFPLQRPAASGRNRSSGPSPSSPLPPQPLSSNRDSLATTATRQSMMSDTTTYSSLLEEPRARISSNVTKFGTIRTMTTDITSIDDEEGYNLDEVEEPQAKPPEEKPLPPPPRERKKPAPIFLGKGKWPEDFMLTPPREDIDNLFGADNDDDLINTSPRALSPSSLSNSSSSPSPPSPSRSPSCSPTPTLGSSPRKVAIVGSPRRPSHRARQSVDAPILMHSPVLRDASPDSSSTGTNGTRIVLRRHSTKPGYRLQTRNRDSPDLLSKPASPVPFPETTPGDSHTPPLERPKVYRGRFQSEIDGSGSRRKLRPNSYDDLGAVKDGLMGSGGGMHQGEKRSRIESMVNLGGISPSAERPSDLLRFNSDAAGNGQPIRKTLVIREPEKPATHFQLGNCIGRGQFGSVYRALNLNTGQMVAVKQLRLEGLNEEEVTQLMKEVDLVKSLSHPSIVKYEGMARDQDTLSIVLEYAENGSLGQTLKAFGKLNERLVASYIVKILEGLDYLHSAGVVHCDLKAANILTTKNGNIKLSDFGVSLNMRAMEKESGVGGTGGPKTNLQAAPSDVAGTPNWMAPEVIELKGANPKSDIWSLGCTVIELLTGRPPYADVSNTMTVMFRIVEDDFPPLPKDCSSLLEDFLKQCFDKDPAKRPSAVELCEHQWLKKNWSGHKEIRPQDSIPFLRRVSADLQKSEVARYLSQIEMPVRDDGKTDDISSSPPHLQRGRSSQQFIPSVDHETMVPREHAFVKTTFSKPMICRVCLLHVKKSAVLCAQCSLIAHSKCSPNSPPTCDLRAQLLLYAQYAEKGNPSSTYSNPVDVLNEALPKGPMSDVSYVVGSPRNSVDQPLSPSQGSQPISIPSPLHSTTPQAPTANAQPPSAAFKLMARLKRSRQNLAADAQQSTSSLATTKNEATARGKARRERPDSLSSDSTNRNSTLGSSTTGRRSMLSAESNLTNVAEADRFVEIPSPSAFSTSSASTSYAGVQSDSIPGGLPDDGHNTRRPLHKRHSQSKSSGNCSIQ